MDRNGAPDLVTIWPGDLKEGTGTHTSLYAQDSWKVTDRVTVEPGVRVAFNRGSTSTTGLVYSTTPVSPRIGGAWDATPDHKTVVRAHWGRFHEAFGTVLYDFTDTDGAPAADHRSGPRSRSLPGDQPDQPERQRRRPVRQAVLHGPVAGRRGEGSPARPRGQGAVHPARLKDMFGYIDTKSGVRAGAGPRSGPRRSGEQRGRRWPPHRLQPPEPGAGQPRPHQPGRRLPALPRLPGGAQKRFSTTGRCSRPTRGRARRATSTTTSPTTTAERGQQSLREPEQRDQRGGTQHPRLPQRIHPPRQLPHQRARRPQCRRRLSVLQR
jgi:hypothetical protein